MNVYKKRLITLFLNQEDNHQLFNKYQLEENKSIQILLDKRFQIFYRKYRLISYIIKILHYESIHFDKNLRVDKSRYQLQSHEFNIDNITTGKIDEYCENSLSLKDHLSNEALSKEFSKLTTTQQKVLTLSFLSEFNDTEIASKLGVSQQSISKTKKTALKKLARGEYCYD